MKDRVADYTFTIIEDGQVPLAGDFSTFSYAPVIAVVVLALIAIALVAYTVWVIEHVKRVKNLNGNSNLAISEYYLHPFKLIRTEEELEYEAIADLT